MAKSRAEIRQNSIRLCPSILIPDRECRYGERCTAEHSVEKYMSSKPPDLGMFFSKGTIFSPDS